MTGSRSRGPIKERAHRTRPLETTRSWVLSIGGLFVFGGLGYLLEGDVFAWPLLVAVGSFGVAVVERVRRSK
jgi:hypothetical protein